MFIKFFNIFVKLFYFYNFYWFLLKTNIIENFKYQSLVLIPKIFNYFIKFYKKNFLFFYIIDNFFSVLFFLYLVEISLEIVFPVAGVVYNRILFEENLI